MSASYLHGGEWVDPADYAEPEACEAACEGCGLPLERYTASHVASCAAELYCAACLADVGDES